MQFAFIQWKCLLIHFTHFYILLTHTIKTPLPRANEISILQFSNTVQDAISSKAITTAPKSRRLECNISY